MEVEVWLEKRVVEDVLLVGGVYVVKMIDKKKPLTTLEEITKLEYEEIIEGNIAYYFKKYNVVVAGYNKYIRDTKRYLVTQYKEEVDGVEKVFYKTKPKPNIGFKKNE